MKSSLPTQVLKQHWGYSQFRPQQLETIQAVLQGRDALVVMATGSGKSIWCAFKADVPSCCVRTCSRDD